MTPPVGDRAFARWLALQAGEELLALRAEQGFADQPALRAAGDKRSQDLIASALQRWRPSDAVLSEEAERDDPRRLAADRVWIIDPLDGTREFGEPGRVDWAVHVALWSRHSSHPSRLEAGAVALPAQHRMLATDAPPAYPPMVDPAPGAGARLRLAVSRTRAPELAVAVSQAVGAELVPMGSAGAKIAAVVTGEVDAYLHAGGQFEWDSAAPVAVATATGLHASRLDGSTLEYNQADSRLPDLLVCRQDQAARLLAEIRAAVTRESR